MTDTSADMLAAAASCSEQDREVNMAGQQQRKASRMRQAVAQILLDEGYDYESLALDAVAFLNGLSDYERCDYMMTLAEELTANVLEAYIVGNPGRTLSVLSANSSERSCARVAKSPSGGVRLLAEFVDAFGEELTLFLDGLAPEFDFSVLREVFGDELRLERAHRGAFSSSSPKFLQFLIREGLCNVSLIRPVQIVECGNALALSFLIANGHDPNYERWDGVHALTHPRRSAVMVDELVAAGAKMESLRWNFDCPSPAALRRMLQLQPELVKAAFSWNTLLINRPVLELMEVMREFDFPPPPARLLDGDAGGFIDWAMFTFGFKKQQPRMCETNLRVRIFWRPHTHVFCEDSIKKRVVAALLCCKRHCPRLPRDMRAVLLIEAVGRQPLALIRDGRFADELASTPEGSGLYAEIE